MQIICLEDKAFYALIDEVIVRINEKRKPETDRWISGDQAMKLLSITSKTTLQKLRNEGKIRFSQPQKKIILYDSESIDAFLDQNAQSTF